MFITMYFGQTKSTTNSATIMEKLLQALHINQLSNEQNQILNAIRKKLDMVVVLPTGSGKSVAYQLAPFCDETNHSKVVIVMPLVALMEQQSRLLQDCGVNAVYAKEFTSLNAALLGDCTHIFLTPELLLSEGIKIMEIMSLAMRRSISHIFINETHCVLKWGFSDAKTTAFRSQYGNISVIRSFLPMAAMIALTATATNKMVQELKSVLQMHESAVVLSKSPVKNNIWFSIERLSDGSLQKSLRWIVEFYSSEVNHSTTDKMLLFCQNFRHMGNVYNHLSSRLGTKIQMYHSKTTDDVKETIIEQLIDPVSQLKVVVCSSAFSMGMDIPTIRYVVHYGVPADLDDYIQEIGRAGRDGKQSFAIIIYHPDSLKGSHVSDASKRYARTQKCLRLTLAEEFETTYERLPAHICCSVCFATCTCCSCDSHSFCSHTHENINCYCVRTCYAVPHFDVGKHSVCLDSIICRHQLDVENLQLLRRSLMAYNDHLTGIVLPSFITRLNYPQLIDSIMNNYQFISKPQDILTMGAYSPVISEHLFSVLNNHCPLLENRGTLSSSAMNVPFNDHLDSLPSFSDSDDSDF